MSAPDSVSAAVDRGVAYLAARQLPDGGFRCTFVNPAAPDEHTPDDASVFPAALVALALADLPGDVAAGIVERAARFLRATMEPPGAWRYWTPAHPWWGPMPTDADDTALATHVLRLTGGAPANDALFLANRDRRGRFYTWQVLRLGAPPRSLAYWRLATRRWRRPALARWAWMGNPDPRDVDAVVNANVLLVLGNRRATRRAVAWLADTVRRGLEWDRDRWYRSPFALYAALSRAERAGVDGFAELWPEVVERIAAAQQGDGAIGESLIDTAYAAGVLAGHGGAEAVRRRAEGHLLAAQAGDGSWATAPVYFDGATPPVAWFGSPEVTTALCLEALSRGTTTR